MMTIPNDDHSISADDAAAAVAAANSAVGVGHLPQIKDEDALHHQYVQHHTNHYMPPPPPGVGVVGINGINGVTGVNGVGVVGVHHPQSTHQFPHTGHLHSPLPHQHHPQQQHHQLHHLPTHPQQQPQLTHHSAPPGPSHDPEDQLNAQLSHQLSQHAAAAAAAAAAAGVTPTHQLQTHQLPTHQVSSAPPIPQQQQQQQHPHHFIPHQPLPTHPNSVYTQHHQLHSRQPTPQQLHSQQHTPQHTPQPLSTNQLPTHHQLSVNPHHQQLHHPQLNQAAQHHLDMLTQSGTPTNGTNTPNEDELLDNTARKVAPRSSDLFRVGPQFSETRNHQEIYCRGTDLEVIPNLEARIDRGFEVGENGTWIGYKRNYFTLVSSFNFEHFNFDRFLQNKYYTYEKLKTEHGVDVERRVDINYFAIRLTPKCSDDDVSISLVQHTAKRDKGPQFPPPIYPAVPGLLPEHEVVKASCNKRNGQKIENMNKVFYFDRQNFYQNNNLDEFRDDSILRNYPSDSISKVARFERIQFTSSIRVKASSMNSRYFTLEVGLLGIVQDENNQIQPILLSSIETPPLIIRGRSPSNYHKDRTSGYRTQGQ